MAIVNPIINKASSKYTRKVMENMISKSDLDENVASHVKDYVTKALEEGIAAGKDKDTVLGHMKDGYMAALTEHGGYSAKSAAEKWGKIEKNYAENIYNGATEKTTGINLKNAAMNDEIPISAYQNPTNFASYNIFHGQKDGKIIPGISGRTEIPFEEPEQISGGSFSDTFTRLSKEKKGNKSWEYSLGRKKRDYESAKAKLDAYIKGGSDPGNIASVAKEYGFEFTPGENYMEQLENHFTNKLGKDPSLWDKAMGHNVPQKVIAGGVTGGAVLAMANRRGQKSNAELYGV